MKRTIALLTVTGLTLLGLFAVAGPAASAATQNVCPSGGASNTTFNGGLLVATGINCPLDHVTVNGGLTVQSDTDVELTNSTVNGGVTVKPGGEIEVGASLFGGVRSTSTVHGGIRLEGPVDWDIETAHIFGGVRITGGVSAVPTFCGNTIYGGMSVAGVSAEISWIGDRDLNIGETPCGRNTIHGSLFMSHDSTFEVEGNRITASVRLNASTLELNANRIGGSLLCTGGTHILPGESPDPSGNSVGGSNTC